MKRRQTAEEKRQNDEKWREIEQRYHENRRRAEERGEVSPIKPTHASECCNAGVLWSQQAIVCKACGKVQE